MLELGGGLIGLVWLAACLFALYNIFTSKSSVLGKLVWGALVFFLPLFGLLIWFFVGPRGKKL